MKKVFTLLSIFSVSIGLWAQTPNAGFENWTTVPASFPAPKYDIPDNWDCANSQSAPVGIFGCLKTTDVHSGATAVKLVTKNIFGNLAPGVVTTGKLPTSTSGSITGGIPYTLRPDSIIGWYKSTPVSGDTCFIKFLLFGAASGNADTLAVATFYTAATVGAYTRFAAPLVYRSSPNPVVNSIWLLSSSINSSGGKANSILFADDLGLVMNPATAVAEQKNTDLTVGPNPSNGMFNVQWANGNTLTIEVYNALGEKVYSDKIESRNSYTTHFNLPEGLYVYSLMDENNKAIKTGKLVIQK